MWEKILNNSGILALIGVFVGFLLSEVTNIFRRHKERKDSKSSLLDEVRFNHEQTKNKIDILDQAIAALEKQRFLSTKCAKYSTYEFEHLYHIALAWIPMESKGPNAAGERTASLTIGHANICYVYN